MIDSLPVWIDRRTSNDMSSGAPHSSPGDQSAFPDCFLPDLEGDICDAARGDELVADGLADEARLPKVLAFRHEPPPAWGNKVAVPAESAGGVEDLELPQADHFADEYGVAFGDARVRLTSLVSGIDREKREASQRVEQLELAGETLRFHLERMEKVQTTGLTRPRLIRELERGLVALDAAEQDLELEWARSGVRKARAARAERNSVMQEWLLNGKTFAMMQVLAFFLPLFIFGIVALILIGTALGWF